MACKLAGAANPHSLSLPVHLHQTYRTSDSGRLAFAVIFSLLLHALLFFFVRFAQPSWKDFSGGASTLKVTLEKSLAESPQQTEIQQASQESKGKAKTGVHETNSFLQKELTATRQTPAEQTKTEIPKVVISKEILTLNKPDKKNPIDSAPDLLVTQTPPPETPENKDKPYAPAPSVENPVAKIAPPAEKLVSSEPAPGEKQEKIVFAEPAQQKSPVAKPGSVIPEAKPVKIEEPKPVEPPPVKIEEPKPVPVEKPKPARIEEPQPVKAEEPKPPKAEEPKPIKTEEAKPIRTEMATDTKTRPAEGEKPGTSGTELHGYKIPSLSNFGIAPIRKFTSDNDRKIKFGERRKTVGLKEQDFRYSMYAESVRLKLQRIGMFNYPAAAAKDNLSGTLSVLISIRSDGSLEEFNVIQPSAYDVLNTGAERIVRMSSPFSPLPENIRQETDVLTIRINWSFSRANQSFD